MAKEAKKGDKNSKSKKSFLKDFKAELKKVTWPTPKQLVNNTTAVIVIVLITALTVFVLDFVFENLNKYGVEKLKTVVRNEQSIDQGSDTKVEEVQPIEEGTSESGDEANSENAEGSTDADAEGNAEAESQPENVTSE